MLNRGYACTSIIDGRRHGQNLLSHLASLYPHSTRQAWQQKLNDGEVTLDIRDNGPGVPPEHRLDIFKPYFTKTQNGTGLGLAVVQQIVLAHGWEIACLPNEPRGALFRLSHLRPSA